MKELKDYIHFYLGCDCELTRIDGEREIIKLTIYNLNYYRGCFKYMKPILRPLSDLTQIEMKELLIRHYAPNEDIFLNTISKITFLTDEAKRNIKRGEGIGYSTFKEDGTHYSTGTLSFIRFNSTQFLYILSLHIDIFGLIEAGLAIDKTILKN